MGKLENMRNFNKEKREISVLGLLVCLAPSLASSAAYGMAPEGKQAEKEHVAVTVKEQVTVEDTAAHRSNDARDDSQELLVNALSAEYKEILSNYPDQEVIAAAQALQLRRAASDRAFSGYVMSNAAYYRAVKQQRDSQAGHDNGARDQKIDAQAGSSQENSDMRITNVQEIGRQLNSPQEVEKREQLEEAFMCDLLAQLAFQDRQRAWRTRRGWERMAELHAFFVKPFAHYGAPVIMIGLTLLASLLPCPSK